MMEDSGRNEPKEGALQEVEDRIAEYEAKKAWYEAKLVELNSRRISLYKDLTGQEPAVMHFAESRQLTAAVEELDGLARELVDTARHLQRRTRSLAGVCGKPPVESDAGVGDGHGIGDILALLAGGTDTGGGEAVDLLLKSPDFKRLALQLLPALVRDSSA